MAPTVAKNKSAFIRQLPLDMSPAEALKKTHSAGFKDATIKDVYRVRTFLNKLEGREQKNSGGGRPKGRSVIEADHGPLMAMARAPVPPAPHVDGVPKNAIRQALMDIVLEIGLKGVEHELEMIRARLKAVAG